jgi:hypothetical protein
MRSPAWRAFDKAAFDWERYGDTDLPRVLYFPSERGGQVILATQSNHLFGLGEPGSQVVLRKGWP